MFKRRNRFCRLACAALSLLLLWTPAVSAHAETLEELQAEQDQLQRQKEETDALLEELQADTAEKKAYRDVLYEQIGTVQGQLDLLRRQIDGLNAEIAEAEDRIAEKQTGIDRNIELLKERIRALYVTGDASALEVILNSTDLFDLTEKAQFLKAIARHDQELVETLTEQLRDIEADLERIQRDKEALSSRKKELDAKGAELAGLYEKAQDLVDDAENLELNAKTNSELLGSRMAENEEAIAALEEELKKQGVSGGYVGTGSFVWPMPGYTYLSCYFGDGGHRGVDIAGGDIYGKPIVAADGGTVLYAGWNDSYGWCVFLDHGNGYETRYAHMSELGTETGAFVEQGQIIGYVGSTGNSTGPHLHFEVIAGGGLTDPMGYF